ncbi:hypothetical protein PG999_013107 [Apiospora kogelbergensis]|uniref:Uncharacterized protein n=1 Tax=Apiospora kogelbergensis TaxID=1337665 RepID=A0AAW0QQ83_9PEZI
MHFSSLFSLFAAAVAVAMAQSQNQTATGLQVFPEGVESCDNGGSDVACRCDDGNCYMRGADENCNLPVGSLVKCDDFYDFSG